MQWHYVKDGKSAGPVAAQDIDKLLYDGALSGSDLVWNSEMGKEWKKISDVPAFSSATGDRADELRLKRKEQDETRQVLQEDYEKLQHAERAKAEKRKDMPRGPLAMACPECGRKLKRWRDPDRALSQMHGLAGMVISYAFASLVCEHCGTAEWRELSSGDKMRSMFGSCLFVLLAIIVIIIAITLIISLSD